MVHKYKTCGQSTQSIQSLLGRQLTGETSGRQMGHKYKIMRPEHSQHPELTGRQVGDKCEIMRPSIQSLLGDKWETSVKSCGQSTESILLGDNWETSIKACGQSTESIQSLLENKGEIMRPGTQARRQTQNHPARACTPLKGVRTPHR